MKTSSLSAPVVGVPVLFVQSHRPTWVPVCLPTCMPAPCGATHFSTTDSCIAVIVAAARWGIVQHDTMIHNTTTDTLRPIAYRTNDGSALLPLTRLANSVRAAAQRPCSATLGLLTRTTEWVAGRTWRY